MNYFQKHKKAMIIGPIVGMAFALFLIFISYSCEKFYRLPDGGGYTGTEDQVFTCLAPIIIPSGWISNFIQKVVLNDNMPSSTIGGLLLFFSPFFTLYGLIGLLIGWIIYKTTKKSITITYFVHGTTTDNENKIATGQLPGELSEFGKKQMIELKNMVADKKFDAVFCSDLKRATDSAQITFGDKYKIITDKRLRECDYGNYNSAPDNFKDNLTDFVDKQFPNGESYSDVEKRIDNFLKDISKKYNGKHIAIVAHQAPQLALEVLLNHKSWPEAIATDWRKTKSWQAGWSYKY